MMYIGHACKTNYNLENSKHAIREKHETEAGRLEIVGMHNINPSQSLTLPSRVLRLLTIVGCNFQTLGKT